MTGLIPTTSSLPYLQDWVDRRIEISLFISIDVIVVLTATVFMFRHSTCRAKAVGVVKGEKSSKPTKKFSKKGSSKKVEV